MYATIRIGDDNQSEDLGFVSSKKQLDKAVLEYAAQHPEEFPVGHEVKVTIGLGKSFDMEGAAFHDETIKIEMR